jgi:hypothetical protein
MSRRDEFDEPGGMPDLTAMQADDALLDLIAYGRAAEVPQDDELARVLVAWQQDVDSEPMPAVFDGEVAVRMMRAANANDRHRRHRRGGRPMLVSLSAAAALVVVALSGVGVAAKSADPGSPLFGVTKVLYSDYAKSAEAAEKVKDRIDEASQALDSGNPMEAQESLAKAQEKLPDVKSDEGADDLKEKVSQLLATLQSRMADPTTDPSQSTDPSASTDPSSSTAPSESTSPESSTDSSTSDSPDPSSSTDPSTSSDEPSTPATGEGTSAPSGSEPATGAPAASEITPNEATVPTI